MVLVRDWPPLVKQTKLKTQKTHRPTRQNKSRPKWASLCRKSLGHCLAAKKYAFSSWDLTMRAKQLFYVRHFPTLLFFFLSPKKCTFLTHSPHPLSFQQIDCKRTKSSRQCPPLVSTSKPFNIKTSSFKCGIWGVRLQYGPIGGVITRTPTQSYL